jgi:hypothetical protein
MAINFDTPLATPPVVYPDDVGPSGIEVVLDNFDIGDIFESEPAPFDANLAETMDDRDLRELSSNLIDLFEQDITSRKDWTRMYVVFTALS